MELNLGFLIAVLVRLVVPLSIFRWPLAGGIASLAVDAVDIYVAKAFGGFIPSYTPVDKYLDLYYLFFEFLVSLRWWNKLARNTSAILFAWRAAGVFVFQVFSLQYFLFLAPNIFENFFLFYLILLKARIERRDKIWLNSAKRLLLVLILLWLVKIPQELILHVFGIKAPVGYFFPNAP